MKQRERMMALLIAFILFAPVAVVAFGMVGVLMVGAPLAYLAIAWHNEGRA